MQKKTLITHFTKEHYLQEILSSECLMQEGCNIKKLVQSPPNDMLTLEKIMLEKQWRLFNMQYKAIGRYVWFTEEQHANCVTALANVETVGLDFFAEDIRALPWSSVKKQIWHRNKGCAQIFLSALEQSARNAGDNPDKWWVCKKTVNMQHCLNITALKAA